MNIPSPEAAELPLFPLGLVLLPQMTTHLHIFEERYREMVQTCVRESSPFGIVRLVQGAEVGSGPVGLASVGCTARIGRVERLPDGRMNIEITGEDRFQIVEVKEEYAYRTARVLPVFDAPADPALLSALGEEVEEELRLFVTRYFALMGQSVEVNLLPQEPEVLSFLAARLLTLTDEEKQALLQSEDTIARLEACRDGLQKERTRLRSTAESAPNAYAPIDPERLSGIFNPN